MTHTKITFENQVNNDAEYNLQEYDIPVGYKNDTNKGYLQEEKIKWRYSKQTRSWQRWRWSLWGKCRLIIWYQTGCARRKKIHRNLLWTRFDAAKIIKDKNILSNLKSEKLQLLFLVPGVTYLHLEPSHAVHTRLRKYWNLS